MGLYVDVLLGETTLFDFSLGGYRGYECFYNYLLMAMGFPQDDSDSDSDSSLWIDSESNSSFGFDSNSNSSIGSDSEDTFSGAVFNGAMNSRNDLDDLDLLNLLESETGAKKNDCVLLLAFFEKFEDKFMKLPFVSDSMVSIYSSFLWALEVVAESEDDLKVVIH